MRRALLTALALIAVAVTIATQLPEKPPPHRGGFSTVRTPSVHVPPELLDGAAYQAELDRRAVWAYAIAHPPTTTTTRPTPAPAPSASNPAGWSADWDGVARCETGGNWQHLGRAPDGSTYDGGLGIYHGAWTDFGGLEFAPRGDLATKEQQIIVAERIYARHGLSGWGCKMYG